MTSMRLAAQDEKVRAENRRRKPNRTLARAKQERHDKPIVVSKADAKAARPYIFGEGDNA